MPQTVYMGRHWRHDHGFTIPDPLLTQQYGIPNACNRCHQDKTVAWALEACDQWYSNRMDRITRTRAQWLARARQHDPESLGPLVTMVVEEELGYWRAAAIEHLDPWAQDPRVGAVLLGGMQDPDPLVRSKAARALEPLLDSRSGVGVRAGLRRALEDPVRAVRVQAAWTLRAEVELESLAGSELRHFLELNADQPGGQMQLGAFEASRDDLPAAARHYAKAVAWDPGSAPIRHDYAVVLSMLGQAQEAIREIEAACRLAPTEAEYRYKLGLALNEVGDLGQTITALQAAVRLDPGHSRAGYNLGLALNASGRVDDALAALRAAEAADAADPRIPYALATILAQRGRTDEARGAVARALALAPEWSDARQLLQLLGGSP
jgi:tetratricopeptide (TPR) repeat protein